MDAFREIVKNYSILEMKKIIENERIRRIQDVIIPKLNCFIKRRLSLSRENGKFYMACTSPGSRHTNIVWKFDIGSNCEIVMYIGEDKNFESIDLLFSRNANCDVMIYRWNLLRKPYGMYLSALDHNNQTLLSEKELGTIKNAKRFLMNLMCGKNGMQKKKNNIAWSEMPMSRIANHIRYLCHNYLFAAGCAIENAIFALTAIRKFREGYFHTMPKDVFGCIIDALWETVDDPAWF